MLNAAQISSRYFDREVGGFTRTKASGALVVPAGIRHMLFESFVLPAGSLDKLQALGPLRGIRTLAAVAVSGCLLCMFALLVWVPPYR